MKYAICIIGHLNPYTAEAVERTVRFIQEARPGPAAVLFLDWAMPDPVSSHDMAKELRQAHTVARWEAALPWYGRRGGFVRVGAAYQEIRPLHERVAWNAQVRGAKNADAAAAAGDVIWGKQQLLEAASAAGCERALCLPPGMWLPEDAPALLEAGLQRARQAGLPAVLSYPHRSVRCDLEGDPLVPAELLDRPLQVRLADLRAGRLPRHDGWWVDLTAIGAERYCNLGVGDEMATCTRILAGGGVGVAVPGMASFLADLPWSHKAGEPAAEAHPHEAELRRRSLSRHEERLRVLIMGSK